MHSKPVLLRLVTSPSQTEGLRNLQALFAKSCNHLAPIVRETRCWNRVALHHLAYRQLRSAFPQLGSQMVCNVIYSVARSARIVYQHPDSPWNVSKLPNQPLPLLRFAATSPVYFDRHTLSLKERQVSLFTLDGRMRFELELAAAERERFGSEKLREIVLTRSGSNFMLRFHFVNPEAVLENKKNDKLDRLELPEYLIVQSDNHAAMNPAGVALSDEACLAA